MLLLLYILLNCVTNERSAQISNLGRLRKLDVLDLHSNAIQDMEGLDSLQDLRVLNLAGNCLRYVRTVASSATLPAEEFRRSRVACSWHPHAAV